MLSSFSFLFLFFSVITSLCFIFKNSKKKQPFAVPSLPWAMPILVLRPEYLCQDAQGVWGRWTLFAPSPQNNFLFFLNGLG